MYGKMVRASELTEHVLNFSVEGTKDGFVEITGSNQHALLRNTSRVQLLSFGVQNSALPMAHIGSVVEEFNRVPFNAPFRAGGNVKWSHGGLTHTVPIPRAVTDIKSVSKNIITGFTTLTFDVPHLLPDNAKMHGYVQSMSGNSVTLDGKLPLPPVNGAVTHVQGSTVTLRDNIRVSEGSYVVFDFSTDVYTIQTVNENKMVLSAAPPHHVRSAQMWTPGYIVDATEYKLQVYNGSNKKNYRIIKVLSKKIPI